MSADWLLLRARSHWRRRWGSLLALTLLVALTGAVVLTTLAGARRTRSVVERADEHYQIPDTFALTGGDTFEIPDAILDSPLVESGDRIIVVAAFSEAGYLPVLAPVDGRFGTDMFFDRVVSGRRPAADAPLEVAISESTARQFGFALGDRIPFYSAARDQARCLDISEDEALPPGCEGFAELFESTDYSMLHGPSFDLEVVGLTRELDEADGRSQDLQATYLSPAFYGAYGDQIPTYSGLVARFAPGVTDQEFESALSEFIGPEQLEDFTYTSTAFDVLDATAKTLANGLLVFAGVAALAGLVAIAQAVARQVVSGASDGAVLKGLGVPLVGRRLDAILPVVPAALGGAFLGALAAWLASPIMPIGSSREVEVSRGLDLDVVVLFGGGLVLGAFVLVAAGAAAAWIGRRRDRPVRLWWGRKLPASVPTGLGIRWALSPGRSARSVPVRSAISGIAVAVAGIVAVAGFSEGLERLTHEPDRTGWGWDVAIDGHYADEEFDALYTRAAEEARAEEILADPDVEGLAFGSLAMRAQVNGRSVPVVGQRVYAGDAGFVVIDGRAPVGTDEVALGAKTMHYAGVEIGDEAHVEDRRMRVVGQAVFPNTGDGSPLAEGALLDFEAVELLGLTASENSFVRFTVDLRDGADVDAAKRRLAELNRGEPPEELEQSTEIVQLGQLADLPAFLTMFLFVVAVLALAHALVLTVRRRRHDVAVVRSLGATSGQSARTIAWQASAIACLGVLVGVPAGVVIGRFVWGAVARAYGVADDSHWPGFAIVVALPTALLVANAIAWWPGRRAAHISPSEALRTE